MKQPALAQYTFDAELSRMDYFVTIGDRSVDQWWMVLNHLKYFCVLMFLTTIVAAMVIAPTTTHCICCSAANQSLLADLLVQMRAHLVAPHDESGELGVVIRNRRSTFTLAVDHTLAGKGGAKGAGDGGGKGSLRAETMFELATLGDEGDATLVLAEIMGTVEIALDCTGSGMSGSMRQTVGDLRLAVVFDESLRTAAVQLARAAELAAVMDGGNSVVPPATETLSSEAVRQTMLKLGAATQHGLGAVSTAARGGFQGIGMGHTAAALAKAGTGLAAGAGELAGSSLAAGESVVDSVVGGIFGGLVTLKRAVSNGVAHAAQSAASTASAGSMVTADAEQPIQLYRKHDDSEN